MRIVTCNGCFDGIHPGHLFFLGFCRAQGDILRVGINSDGYIRRNKREPFYSQHKRQKALMSLGFIHDVFVFDEPTPESFLVKMRPDVHCTGEENGLDCPESKVCKELDIKLILVPRINYWSTSDLEKEERELVDFYMQRLLDKERSC